MGSFRFCIFPLVSISPANSKAQSEFYEKLDGGLLNLIVIPHRPTPEDCIAAASLRLKGIHVILSAPDDIDAIASSLWTLEELAQYKYFRVFLQGGVDADAAFTGWQEKKYREQIGSRTSLRIPSANKFIENRQDDPRSWIAHPKFEKTLEAVSNNSCVFIVGDSASGKSTLALSVGMRHEARGSKVLYINIATLTDQQAFDIGYYLFQESLKQEKKLIIILDDLHCRPEIGSRFLGYLKTFSVGAGDICVMAIFWPQYLEDFRKIRSDAAVIRLDAADVKDGMISKIGGSLSLKTRNEISEFAGNDLLILRLALETVKEHGLSDYGSVAQQIWRQRSQGLRGDKAPLTRAVLVASLLGQYECYVTEEYLESRAGTTKDQIEELKRNKLLVQKDDRYSLPHRSFARLLTQLLSSQKDLWAWFQSRIGVNNPPKFVLDYLEFLDPSEVWNALELITKTEKGKTDAGKSQRDASFITQSWKNIDTLLQKIYDQQALDATWGKTISSMTFAIEALGAVGEGKRAQASIEFIRNLYRLDSGRMRVSVESLSTVKDFEQIRIRMDKEEKALTYSHYPFLETAESIDIGLMHENWACGLVLCTESALRGSDNESTKLLARSVESSGDFFYPARVPWITARVLIGLGRAGRSVENSDVVKRVANWLLRSRAEGGARESIFWTSGTGTWNTSLEVTAMCIIALCEVGVPSTHPVLIDAMEWLSDQKKNWTEIGHELDGAVAIESYLQMNRPWNEII
ncbi:MAG: ATP-binding protein, partial [Candidatus Kuenenia stuttgartiensis]|nr:ATP-binding protein [Candidatus Kuenenia stuttgartiensis]